MLARLHSRHSAYALLAIMAAAMEGIFGWRASVMYEHFLAPYVDFWELWAFRIVVFLGVAVGGYVLATHRQYGLEAIAMRIRVRGGYQAAKDSSIWWNGLAIVVAMGVVVIHDWAGVIYTVFGAGARPNFINASVTIGMCVFCLLPFLLGHMMLALAESINAERDEEYDRTIDKLDRTMRIQAAKELVKQASDMSAEERLSYGVRGLLPDPARSPESPKSSALPAFQADEQSQNGANLRNR
jgi:hypothetical protein